MKDSGKFQNFMIAIGELFDRQISTLLQDVYWKAIEPFSDEQCEKAFNSLVLSARFFPKRLTSSKLSVEPRKTVRLEHGLKRLMLSGGSEHTRALNSAILLSTRSLMSWADGPKWGICWLMMRSGSKKSSKSSIPSWRQGVIILSIYQEDMRYPTTQAGI